MGEQDRVLKIDISILTVLMLVVAGLDVGRYLWTGPVGPWLPIAALVIVVLGYLFMAWATQTNRFFSSAVRLQTDRGQVVVDSDPYRLVRHPGYARAIRYLAFVRPLARLVAGYLDCWRAHDCDSATPHAA